MEKETRELLTDEVVAAAAGRYDMALKDLELLGGFESFVYEVERGGRPYILRLTHADHRPYDQIRGEVEWINYLAAGGVACPPAVPSVNDRLAEALPAGFTAVLFERAPGRPPQPADMEPALFATWGRTLGRLHALTRRYEPSTPAVRRHAWHEDPYVRKFDSFLPPGEEVIGKRFAALQETLRTLPTTGGGYGLIHDDAHAGNFFVDDGRITLFDFDDAKYSWLASDIAIVLFYTTTWPPPGREPLDLARELYDSFMEGYAAEHVLSGEWLARIPLFLKLREMLLYGVIHAGFAADAMPPGLRAYLDERKEHIEEEVPVLDLEFV